jgi:hypothetical protein
MVRRRQRSERRANENFSCDHDVFLFVIGGAIAAHNVKTDKPKIFTITPDLFPAFWLPAWIGVACPPLLYPLAIGFRTIVGEPAGPIETPRS